MSKCSILDVMMCLLYNFIQPPFLKMAIPIIYVSRDCYSSILRYTLSAKFGTDVKIDFFKATSLLYIRQNGHGHFKRKFIGVITMPTP